jgi:hypothetical protein
VGAVQQPFGMFWSSMDGGIPDGTASYSLPQGHQLTSRATAIAWSASTGSPALTIILPAWHKHHKHASRQEQALGQAPPCLGEEVGNNCVRNPAVDTAPAPNKCQVTHIEPSAR